MTLVKYRPNTLLADLLSDDLFLNVFNDDKFHPAYDIVETDVDYKINLMVPGLDKKNFKVEVDEDKLIVKGERSLDESTKFTVKQSYYGKFEKVYILPKNTLHDDITAKYENGVLLITVPKNVEKAKSKLIEIV